MRFRVVWAESGSILAGGGGEIVRISVVFLVYLDFPWYCPRVFQVFSCFSFATSCDFPEASLYFSRFFLFFSCFFLVFWETGEGGIEIVRFSVVFLVYLGIALGFSLKGYQDIMTSQFGTRIFIQNVSKTKKILFWYKDFHGFPRASSGFSWILIRISWGLRFFPGFFKFHKTRKNLEKTSPSTSVSVQTLRNPIENHIKS